MLLEGISGNKADVNDAHEALVADGGESLKAAVSGDGYVLHLDGITNSGADYLIALIINRDARDLVVTKADIACNSTEEDGIYEINLGGTFTHDVANGTLTLPNSVRSGDAPLSSTAAECYVNDGDGDMTTEANAYVAYAKKSALQHYSIEMSIPGGFVIPTGQSFSLSQVKDGCKTYGCIHFYFRD